MASMLALFGLLLKKGANFPVCSLVIFIRYLHYMVIQQGKKADAELDYICGGRVNRYIQIRFIASRQFHVITN